MSDEPRCYGIRRLNPLRGVLQVLELPGARALSADGRRWEIQVLAARPEHDWRSPNRGEPILQYFRFGIWTPENGLGRVPVSPILDLERMLAGAERLSVALAGCQDRLPFPPGDPYELWLLDARGRALALMDTATEASATQGGRADPWSACVQGEQGFTASSLLAAGVPAPDGGNPRRHAAELEQRVRKRADSPPQQAWFLRSGGEAASSLEPDRELPVGGFPQLPLSAAWDLEADNDLVWDYLNWRAPALLTLSGIAPDTRRHLEQAARAHAVQVEQLHRLFPQIIDRKVIAAARVEARLRWSG